jgi:hypothetical protein
MEWLGKKEVGFGLTGIAWNGGSRSWTACCNGWTLGSRLKPEWNGFDWQNLFMACLDRLAMAKVDFGLTQLVSPTLC